jgi:hypothetical protein
MSNLRILSLVNTAVTDDGLEALSELPALSAVNLYRTQVTNSGVNRLKLARPGLIVEQQNTWRPD